MVSRIVVASGNTHKIEELIAMIGRSNVGAVRALEVVPLGALPFAPAPEIAETAPDFVGNALLKANGVAAWLREKGCADDDLVLADDSGLCVEALDGAPGVHSARFAGEQADDGDNNAKLVAALQERELDASPAHYVCVLAMRHVGTRPFDFTMPESEAVSIQDDCLCIEGRCHGKVRVARQGEGGFGYDPHFWIDEDTRTFAELARGEKAVRSHRGSAMAKLMRELPLMVL